MRENRKYYFEDISGEYIENLQGSNSAVVPRGDLSETYSKCSSDLAIQQCG